MGHGGAAAVFEERPGCRLAGGPRPRWPGPRPTRADPVRAAELIAEHARADRIDLDLFAAEQTRQTSHSMLGLIRALQAVLPEQARDYVYAGATVQDITDTWIALALREIGGLVWRDLRRIEEPLLALAAEHRDTVMAGRTHGQPGAR